MSTGHDPYTLRIRTNFEVENPSVRVVEIKTPLLNSVSFDGSMTDRTFSLKTLGLVTRESRYQSPG